MPCFKPIPAYQEEADAEVVLWPKRRENLLLPCGSCVGCRQARAAQWATRAVHEAQQNRFNAFVTLTYSDKYLPADGGLFPRDLVSFLKKVRHALVRHQYDALLGERMRYLACGEYGDTGGRPHYHALLFGIGFGDGVPCGEKLYTSGVLRALWPYGNVSFGSVTGASAAYVAQYSLKKTAAKDWNRCNPETGELLKPPFLRCSLRPGIGKVWAEKYAGDARHGYIVRDGKKVAVPRYYQKQLECTDVGLYEEFRENAQRLGKENALTAKQRKAAHVIELSRLGFENPRNNNL